MRGIKKPGKRPPVTAHWRYKFETAANLRLWISLRHLRLPGQRTAPLRPLKTLGSWKRPYFKKGISS